MNDSNGDDRRPDASPEDRRPAEAESGARTGDRDGRGRDPGGGSAPIASEERRRHTPLISAAVAVIGAWVAVSALVYDFGAAALWNNALVGSVVLVAGAYNCYRLINRVPLSVGVASLVAILGIWLIVVPALFGMTGGFWSTLVSGLLVAGLAGYDAYEARATRSVAIDPDAETP